MKESSVRKLATMISFVSSKPSPHVAVALTSDASNEFVAELGFE
jgi:hypothetical protein